MSKRRVKPKIQYFWQWNGRGPSEPAYRVKWRLIDQDGNELCESSQDYYCAARAKEAVSNVVNILGSLYWEGSQPLLNYREVGPGRKPQ